jgi:hypothetical protein
MPSFAETENLADLVDEMPEDKLEIWDAGVLYQPNERANLSRPRQTVSTAYGALGDHRSAGRPHGER